MQRSFQLLLSVVLILFHPFRVQFQTSLNTTSRLAHCRQIHGVSRHPMSSPLVSGVVLHLLHSFRVQFYIFSTRFGCSFTSSPPVSIVVLHLLHPFRVYFSHFSHSFRVQISPQVLAPFPVQVPSMTSDGVLKFSNDKRVPLMAYGIGMWPTLCNAVMKNYTRNEWGRCKNTLETSGEDVKIHSKRVGKMC